MSEDQILFGTVVWFNIKSGIGFIKQANDEKDMFVHYTDVVSDSFKTLYKDQKVSYSIGTNLKGQPKAINVKVIL